MFSPGQLHPFLGHHDRFVRAAVTAYFHDSWSRDPDLLPRVLQACERYGLAESRTALAYCSRFVATPESFEEMLKLRVAAPDREAAEALDRALARAPVDVLAPRLEVLDELPGFPEGLRGLANQRCRFAGWPAEWLWPQAQELARQGYTGEADAPEDDGEALVEALARHAVPDDATLCRLLEAPPPDAGRLDLLLIDLAGARGCRAAVPLLVERLHEDDDASLERCYRALVRVADPEAVRLIREGFVGAQWHFALYGGSVLGAIKHPDAEEAALALVETEPDETVRTNLCESLCDLFSRRGAAVVRETILAGYDREYSTLEDRLLPVLDVLGLEVPEAEAWRAQREERERAEDGP